MAAKHSSRAAEQEAAGVKSAEQQQQCQDGHTLLAHPLFRTKQAEFEIRENVLQFCSSSAAIDKRVECVPL